MRDRVKEYLKSVMPEGSTIVEVGAHYGEDSTGFLRSLNPKRLFCFEPDPRNVAIFKQYVNDPTITLVECAVSSKNEKDVDFHLSYRDSFGSKMFEKYHWIDRKEYVEKKLNASGASSLKKGGPHPILSTVKVETIRLDTWAAACGIYHINLAWVDVQGAERDVVESFGDLIIDRVWIEYGESQYIGAMTREQTIKLMNQKDFSLVDWFSDRTLRGDLLFERK